MEQIRIRFQELLSMEKHTVRTTEHKAFSRLMYRNRNQHRHGFYFRKLEEVRRLLRRIQQHIAWNSVRQAVIFKGTEKRYAPKNAPLALSSVTQDDVKSLEKLYGRFVHETVPSTVRQITIELICRSHFLPFAVSMVSMLSRIFVVEKKILQELRGASLELGLLFPVQERPDLNNAGLSRTEGCSVEDVGTKVTLLENDQAKRCSLPSVTANDAISVPQMNSSIQKEEKACDVLKLPSSESRTELEKVSGPPSNDKSIYDLISSKTKAPQFSTMRTGRAMVPIPLSCKFRTDGSEQKDSQSDKHNEALSRSCLPKCNPVQEREVVGVSSLRSSVGLVANRRNTSEMNQEASAVAPNQRAEESGGSDSEDLDDIFGALDD